MLIVSDLDGLTSNQIDERAWLTCDKSVCTDAAGPPIVESSKYQMFTCDLIVRQCRRLLEQKAQDRESHIAEQDYL